MTATQSHWDQIYRSKKPDELSWHAPHLETSLALIKSIAETPETAIIDIGGGESMLIDDLIRAGYQDLSVLDLSSEALEVAKRRLGNKAEDVEWLHADITDVALTPQRYDLWHDRAVFHFLTEAKERSQYVERVKQSVRPGGYVIIATFGPEGPDKCSGLDVVRYDTKELHGTFGPTFKLVQSRFDVHKTPWGSQQQFLYCMCQVST